MSSKPKQNCEFIITIIDIIDDIWTIPTKHQDNLKNNTITSLLLEYRSCLNNTPHCKRYSDANDTLKQLHPMPWDIRTKMDMMRTINNRFDRCTDQKKMADVKAYATTL